MSESQPTAPCAVSVVDPDCLRALRLAYARVREAARGLVRLPDELHDAIQERGEQRILDCARAGETYLMAVDRLLGGMEMMNMVSPSPLFCREFVRRCHAAFGAPGDWGYGTPLGDALRGLYAIELRETAGN